MNSAGSQHSIGAMDCYVTVQEFWKAAHSGCRVSTDGASGEVHCGVPKCIDAPTLQPGGQFQRG
eukprot:415957-Prymnesium_polylepis.1